MAIHYMGDIKHMTCQTEKGYRRSPLSDISYNCGQALTDDYNNHTYHRKHYDGTQILDTDMVFADDSCIYADNSITSDKRRNMMYNDLYRLNKSNNERIYWKTEIALPNNLTDKQLIEISRKIALSFSEHFHRPIDYSIHKKPATKKKVENNHLHLASPERTYENGKWGAKSTSYYVSRDDKLIYDKNYKDANGNDIRKPRTIGNAKPVYAINPETGLEYCTNQRKDAKGRLQWKKTDINALDKEALQWMHDEIDRIQNIALVRYGIDDYIQRNDKRTTKELKDAGIKAQHIGKRDMETQGESYQEKTSLNRRYDFFKETFNSKFKKLDAAERSLAAAEKAEALAEENYHSVAAEKNRFANEKEKMQSDFDTSVIDYVENELRPEELFVKHSMSEFNKAVNLAHANIIPIITTMNSGIAAVDSDVKHFNRRHNPTDREKLFIEYAKTNAYHMERYRNAANKIFKSSLSAERMQTSARKRWRRSQGWLTRNYIRKVLGEDAACLYEIYLQLKKLITSKEKHNNRYLYPITCENAIQSVINGSSVPGIKSRIRNNQTMIENAIRITAENNSQYNKDAQSELHLPPANAEPLVLWHNVPNRMIQLTDEDKITYYNPLLDYNPQKDYQNFQKNLKDMDSQTFQSVTHQQNALTQTQVTLNSISNVITVFNDYVKEHPEEHKKRTHKDYDKIAAMRDAEIKNIRDEAMDYHPDPTRVAKMRTDRLFKEFLKLPIPDKERKVERAKKLQQDANDCWYEINADKSSVSKSKPIIDLTPDNSRTRVPDNARK